MMMSFAMIWVLVLAVALVALVAALQKGGNGRSAYEDAQIKAAGNAGERYVTQRIRSILHDDDVLLTNVCITCNGQKTELDDVIINTRGIYFLEVKNYHGRLFGGIDDDTWYKTKVTPGGNSYDKEVRNPIKQMKRQTYILNNLLKRAGIKVPGRGFVYFVEGNSPVADTCVLKNESDLDEVIHDMIPHVLTDAQVQRVAAVLQRA